MEKVIADMELSVSENSVLLIDISGNPIYLSELEIDELVEYFIAAKEVLKNNKLNRLKERKKELEEELYLVNQRLSEYHIAESEYDKK